MYMYYVFWNNEQSDPVVPSKGRFTVVINAYKQKVG